MFIKRVALSATLTIYETHRYIFTPLFFQLSDPVQYMLKDNHTRPPGNWIEQLSTPVPHR